MNPRLNPPTEAPYDSAMQGGSPLDRRVFRAVSQAAQELGQPVWIVGGFVRDLLLEREWPGDIDFVTLGSGIELAKAAAKQLGHQGSISVFKNFGTAMFKSDGFELEFVGARKESYRSDSRKPSVENGSLQDDQNRRDFTINALAISLNEHDYGSLIDPFGGIEDLKNRKIRTPLSPDETFSDDPLRMMRAVRFSAQLDFEIVPEALEAIKRNAHRLNIVSAERILVEFNKVMDSPMPGSGLSSFESTGLLAQFFPELVALKGVEEREGQNHKDNFYHTLEVVDTLSLKTSDLWMRWAALLHDIGKPVVKRFDRKAGWTFHNHEFVGARMVPKIFARLKLPLGEPQRLVQKMVLLSSRPVVLSQDEVTDSAVRRLLFEAGDDIDRLMMLCESDITTKNASRKARYLRNFELVRRKLKEVEESDRLRNWQPPIDGAHIMKSFGIGPGREVGEIKNAIREAILDGRLRSEPGAAHEFMIETGRALGLSPRADARPPERIAEPLQAPLPTDPLDPSDDPSRTDTNHL